VPHDKRYFVGMPTPAAAGFVAATIYCFPDRLEGDIPAIAAVFMITLLAFLMVSRIKYRTFKDLNLKQPHSFRIIALIGLIFVGLAFDLKRALIILATLYTLSGMIGYVFGRKRRRTEQPAPEPTPAPINPS